MVLSYGGSIIKILLVYFFNLPAVKAPCQVRLVVGRGEVETGGRHLFGGAVGALGLGERPVGKGPEEDSAAS